MCRFVPLELSTVVVGLLVAGWACSGPDESNGEHQQPAGPITGNAQNARLAEVRHWLYLIDVNLDEETIDLMAASEYDLVVLDFIPSERGNTDYPMAQVVAWLQNAPRPKLVLVYIDIGEAEDYRSYWQEGWREGEKKHGGSNGEVRLLGERYTRCQLSDRGFL